MDFFDIINYIDFNKSFKSFESNEYITIISIIILCYENHRTLLGHQCLEKRIKVYWQIVTNLQDNKINL